MAGLVYIAAHPLDDRAHAAHLADATARSLKPLFSQLSRDSASFWYAISAVQSSVIEPGRFGGGLLYADAPNPLCTIKIHQIAQSTTSDPQALCVI